MEKLGLFLGLKLVEILSEKSRLSFSCIVIGWYNNKMVFIIQMLVSYLKGIDSICSNFRLISVIFI